MNRLRQSCLASSSPSVLVDQRLVAPSLFCRDAHGEKKSQQLSAASIAADVFI